MGKSFAQLLTRSAVLIAVGLAAVGGGRGWIICGGAVEVRRRGGGGRCGGWMFWVRGDGSAGEVSLRFGFGVSFAEVVGGPSCWVDRVGMGCDEGEGRMVGVGGPEGKGVVSPVLVPDGAVLLLIASSPP